MEPYDDAVQYMMDFILLKLVKFQILSRQKIQEGNYISISACGHVVVRKNATKMR